MPQTLASNPTLCPQLLPPGLVPEAGDSASPQSPWLSRQRRDRRTGRLIPCVYNYRTHCSAASMEQDQFFSSVRASRNGKKKWQQVNCGQELGLSLRERGMTPNKAKAAGQELHEEISSLAMAWIILGFRQKAPLLLVGVKPSGFLK